MECDGLDGSPGDCIGSSAGRGRSGIPAERREGDRRLPGKRVLAPPETKIAETVRTQLGKEICLEAQHLQNIGLRMGLQGGGCSGLSYTLNFEPEVREQDQAFEIDGIKVIVDSKSLLYLDGTTLDYVNDLNGSGFKFINPNAVRTCGCGSSFSA